MGEQRTECKCGDYIEKRRINGQPAWFHINDLGYLRDKEFDHVAEPAETQPVQPSAPAAQAVPFDTTGIVVGGENYPHAPAASVTDVLHSGECPKCGAGMKDGKCAAGCAPAAEKARREEYVPVPPIATNPIVFIPDDEDDAAPPAPEGQRNMTADEDKAQRESLYRGIGPESEHRGESDLVAVAPDPIEAVRTALKHSDAGDDEICLSVQTAMNLVRMWDTRGEGQPCEHFWRTVERNGKWVTECEKCHVGAPEGQRESSVPSHVSPGIGAGGENTGRVQGRSPQISVGAPEGDGVRTEDVRRMLECTAGMMKEFVTLEGVFQVAPSLAALCIKQAEVALEMVNNFGASQPAVTPPLSPNRPVHNHQEAHGYRQKGCPACDAMGAEPAVSGETRMNGKTLYDTGTHPIQPDWKDRAEKAESALAQQAGELEKWKSHERNLSDAYLRLRRILKAWDTPYAPTGEQIWSHTEDCAEKIVAERDRLREALQSIVNLPGKYDLGHRAKLLAEAALAPAVVKETKS